MDVQVLLISLGIFIISAGILLSISLFGMKEKTYEEAMAEQRQQTHALLGHNTKTKSKDNKKQKKTIRKAKEKLASNDIEKESTEESENTDSNSPETTTPVHQVESHSKLHVEFKEPTDNGNSKTIKETANSKKKQKKDKIRSILIHSKNKSLEATTEVEVETLPANHFEEIHPKDEFELKHLSSNENPVKQEILKGNNQKEKQRGKQLDIKKEEKITKDNINELEVMAISTSEGVAETETHLLAGYRGQNQALPNKGLVKEKKKKKTEINSVHSLGDNLSTLLNSVRSADLSRCEVQILIDLLLNKQHEAPVIIDEWMEGRSDPLQKLKKQLAEKEKAYIDEQEALAAAQAKLREIRSEQTANRNQMQQKIRSLEETLQTKLIEFKALNNHLHSQNQKVSQMQAQINDDAIKLMQIMEEKNLQQIKAQKLEIKLTQFQEREIAHMQLEKDFQELQEMHAQMNNHHGQVVHSQVAHFKKELEQKDDYMAQLQKQISDLEHRKNTVQRIENDLRTELLQLKSTCQQQSEEIRRLEHSKSQTLDELKQSLKQKEEFEKLITQLKSDLGKIEEEKVNLEKNKLNGSKEESKMHQVELLNLHNELTSTKLRLQQNREKYSEEFDSTIKKLNKQLDEQTIKSTEEILKVQMQEQELSRKFLQRLFPDLNVSTNLPYNEWLIEFEKAISRHVQYLKQSKSTEGYQEVEHLKDEIQKYKHIIDEFENILKNLQEHVEREELNWQKKLQEKENELEQLRTS